MVLQHPWASVALKTDKVQGFSYLGANHSHTLLGPVFQQHSDKVLLTIALFVDMLA